MDQNQNRRIRPLASQTPSVGALTALHIGQLGWGSGVLSLEGSSRTMQAPDHLVVFSHGLDGHPDELTFISTHLRERYRGRVVTHLAISYHTKSHDGLDNAGVSTADEVEELTTSLRDNGITIRCISFVGHSLGGLVARYAVGVLYDRGFFDRIKPVNFTTFATPHLGTMKIPGGSALETLIGHAFNRLVPLVKASRSIAQLFLQDDHAGRPLLAAMAEADSSYYRALELFPHKSVYSNVTGDLLVPYYTAAISAGHFAVGAYPHMSGYGRVVFDLNASATTTSESEKGPASGQAPVEKPLVLQEHQRTIFESLDALPWSRYPVHVSSWNAHTAILVFKVLNQDNCEGKTVVKHYADMFVIE